MGRPTFDDVYLVAALTMGERSTCRRRKVGCVIVNDDFKVLSTGYNGVPMSMTHCIDIPCTGADAESGTMLDRCEAVHAEQNALMQCHDVMQIGTIYCTTKPCSHCAKMIANTGCKRVVFLHDYPGSQEFGDIEYIKYEVKHFDIEYT